MWFQLAKMRLTSSNLPLVVGLMTRLDILGLAPKGRKQLEIETSRWDKLAGAIARILRPAAQE
jgi:hypothetical protein